MRVTTDIVALGHVLEAGLLLNHKLYQFGGYLSDGMFEIQKIIFFFKKELIKGLADLILCIIWII